jgi:DNA-directed RNA polymerase subunit K/omega
MIKNCENMTAKEIAEQELKLGVTPFIIERQLPNGKKERWHLSELEIVN